MKVPHLEERQQLAEGDNGFFSVGRDNTSMEGVNGC